MKFVEIDTGLSINFEKVLAITRNPDDPMKTDIFIGEQKFVSMIPHDVLKKLLNAGANDLEKYVKQLAVQNRYATP